MTILLTLSVAVNSALCILLWLVQAIIYPAFHSIAEDRFTHWHAGYVRKISMFVIPLMWCQAVLLTHSFWEQTEWPPMTQLLLAAAGWLITFVFAVPCHNKLSMAKDPVVIDRLIQANLWRTLAWTIIPILDFYRLLN